MAVSRAVSIGRLSQSIRDGKIIDPDLADREWEASTDLSKAPGYVRERVNPQRKPSTEEATPAPPTLREGMNLAEASAAEKYWKAKQAELNYREDAAELIPARDVRRRLEEVFLTCKTKLLGVPSRARQLLPHLTVADVTTLDALVRESLEELAGEGEADH
jgi:phage terminase Nu1 subunit (DNA packaging protein)